MFKKTVSIVIVSVLAISIGTVSVFADTVPNTGTNWYNRERYYLDDNILYEWIGVTWTTPYIVNDYGTLYNQSSDKTLIAQDYFVQVTFSNSSATDTVVYSRNHFFFDITNTIPSDLIGRIGYQGYSIGEMGESATIGIFPSSSYAMQNRIYPKYEYLGSNDQNSIKIVLPPGFKYNFNYKLTLYSLISEEYIVSLGLNGLSIPVTNINVSTGLNNYSWSVDNSYVSNNPTYNIKSILDAYTSNVQGSEDLVNDISSNDEKLDNIHQSEAQWYSQNSQAIESTGLSNFEFSTDQSSALTGVFSLFQRLWTALGDYTFVVTFTLMMSFATFFLRHNPVKKTSGNNYSRNYSKGDGESHGSSTG